MFLRPYSFSAQLGLVWREWSAFEGWTGHSINFIVGGPKHALVHPVPAAAAWVGLALALYWAWTRIRRRPPLSLVWILVPLLGWLALDARWLFDLGRQNLRTEQQFMGKTDVEKHLADKDGSLYRFVQRVKQALPEEPRRVFLVTQEPFARSVYIRQRASYHLLPHNVYSHLARPPDADQVRSDDYVLLLGRVAESVAYDRERGVLEWPGGRLSAAPALVDRDGSLFRVIEPQGAANAGG